MKVVLLKPSRNDEAIEYARRLLERCETGEVVSIYAVVVNSAGAYISTGTGTESTAERTGMLFSAAVDSAKYAVLDGDAD